MLSSIKLLDTTAMVVVPENLALAEALNQRRQRLGKTMNTPAIFWSGRAPARNYPGSPYPFRANSHFLYLAGLPLENAAIRVENGKLELYVDEGGPAAALWHGETPSRDAIAEAIGADAAFPLSELEGKSRDAATIPVQDAYTQERQSKLLERPISARSLSENDLKLANAMIELRLIHDAFAIAQVREAVATTVAAHKAGMRATPKAKREAQVRAVIEGIMVAEDVSPAYGSIVTVHGEVLHNEQYHHAITPGELLLVDAGAESSMGWSSDITRTWPTAGHFSPTQRAIYEVVLAAHDRCIAAMAPGVEYRDIHLLAAQVLAEGLVDLGVLVGNPEDLVAQDAHALFFPHGIGHLLGLDVHDMEDLGDLAGYAEGRTRSKRFGLGYLRLDRILKAGMITTIEPGFYQVAAILDAPANREKYQKMVNWNRLAEYADVRGIRIEDDILVTEEGSEVLSAALPCDVSSIEQMVLMEV
jgi:Xaa-Pro aminopeptidase